MLSGHLPGVSCMHKDVKDTKATGKKTEKGKIGTIQVIIIGACLCVVVWFIYDFKYSQKNWLWRKSPINFNSLSSSSKSSPSDAKDKTKRSNNIFHKNKVLNGAPPSKNADRNMNLNTDENMNINGLRIGFLPYELQPFS